MMFLDWLKKDCDYCEEGYILPYDIHLQRNHIDNELAAAYIAYALDDEEE